MGKARELAQRGIDLFNQADIDGLVATCTEDAIEVFPTGEYKGRAEIRERLREQQHAFPDRAIRPLRWVEDGDTIAVEYEYTATHDGPLRLPDGTVLPATGQHVRFLGVSILEFRDEQCAVHILHADMAPTLIQLGVLAPKTPG